MRQIESLDAEIGVARQGAENGDADARFQLANLLVSGSDDQKREAVEILRTLADQNYAQATNTLAWCFRDGIGAAKDEQQATALYSKAAELGNAEAQFHEGLRCANGTGIEMDDKKAAEWYRKAAEQGHANAQLTLGLCYAAGTGVAQDETAALQWFEKAQQAGHPVAALHILKLRDATAGPLSAKRAELRLVPKHRLLPPFELLAESTFGQAVLCRLVADFFIGDVVVKVPKDSAISQAWLNEWLALGALPKHDNVISIIGLCPDFDCVDANGAVLKPPISFVSRYFAHGSIVDYFSKPENRGKSSAHMLPWAFDIARGLDHLHEHKIVHRDLAARNVFIADDMSAVVGDLGLARAVDEEKGTFVSEGKSAAYPIDVAAEVLVANAYTPASDMFRCLSVGCFC